MTTEVWLSLMLQDVKLIKLIGPDRAFQTRVYENRSRDNFHNWGKAIENADDFPTTVYGSYHDKIIGKLPDLMSLGGYICVSARLKAILSEFDLSGAMFHPIKAFEHDRATPIAGDYYFLNFGRQFDAVNIERSQGLKKRYEDKDDYKIQAKFYDDPASIPVCLGRTALPGKDLWANPKIHGIVFLSNRLVDRLRKEKLAKLFNLRACEVVDI